jgi:hypothetical protein
VNSDDPPAHLLPRSLTIAVWILLLTALISGYLLGLGAEAPDHSQEAPIVVPVAPPAVSEP